MILKIICTYDTVSFTPVYLGKFWYVGSDHLTELVYIKTVLISITKVSQHIHHIVQYNVIQNTV